MNEIKPGTAFRKVVSQSSPLQIVGTINAYTALMAEHLGFQAIYLSGAGVANASLGLPDLGMTNLNDVLIDAYRITNATSLPLLVDIDTGWGNALNIARTIKQMMKAGVAAVHMEDQVQAKRCGHRPGKAIVSQQEMVDRIKAAVDARTDPSFVIMARTDAVANEGLEAAITRIQAYVEAGADMIFPEALTELSQYQHIAKAIQVPILANMTEFGKTPLFSLEELKAQGVDMVLYPLSAFRAMNKAAQNVYQTIKTQGTQSSLLPMMQSREELYDFLDYYHYEKIIDQLQRGENDE